MYGHALELALGRLPQCVNHPDRMAVVVSDRDGRNLCARCERTADQEDHSPEEGTR